MNKKPTIWKTDSTSNEFIIDENGLLYNSMIEIVIAHNAIVASLQEEIAALKEETSNLKYNILVKSYDRTKGD